MNERTMKLALQAGGEFYKGFAGSPNSVEFTENEFQKFAELIVKECAAVAFRLAPSDESACDIYAGIEEHFGVK